MGILGLKKELHFNRVSLGQVSEFSLITVFWEQNLAISQK